MPPFTLRRPLTKIGYVTFSEWLLPAMMKMFPSDSHPPSSGFFLIPPEDHRLCGAPSLYFSFLDRLASPELAVV